MLDNSDNGHRNGLTYLFEPFRLDATEKVLWRGEQAVPLTPKTFDLLIYFVQNNGHLVEKDELLKRVWPDAFVEESTLAHNIYLLRKALGDDSSEVRYIENVPRRGYRFTAAISELPSTGQVIDKVHEGLPPTNTRPPMVAQPPTSLFAQLNRRWTWKHSALLTAALVLVVTGWRASWSPRSPQQANDDLTPKRLAVLPFRYLGSEPTDEYRGLGIADAMITKLSKLRSLSVLPTSSIFKYADQPQDAVAIGQKLGADTVLDGTVQSAGDRVRLTVQMIRVSDGTTVWSERFDERFTNIFALEDAMSDEVAQALSVQMSADERKGFLKRYTVNAEAYQSYMMGLFFCNKRTREGISKAIQSFQQAVDKDPNYALAYAGLAESYNLSDSYGYAIVPRGQAHEMAKNAAAKALTIDDTLAEAHTAQATVQWKYEAGKAGAERSLKRAITLNGNYAIAHLRYAWLLFDEGRLNEAIREMKDAWELEPTSPITNMALARMYYFDHKYDESIKHDQMALEIDPDNSVALYHLCIGYEREGMYDEALARLQKLKDLDGSKMWSLERIAHVYAMMGRSKEARSILRELDRPDNRKKILPTNIASIYVALKENDSAFRWLEIARAGHSLEPQRLRSDPEFEVLKSDPRFQELVRN